MIQVLVQFYKKIPKRLITTTFIILIVVFLVVYLRGTDFSNLRHLRVDWWWVVVGSLWAILFRYWAVYIWRVILRALGTEMLPNFSLMSYIFAKAWMARYIPGTITWIAGRMYMAASYGISKSRMAVSSLLEGGMQVVAAVVVSLPLLGFNSHLDSIPFIIRVIVVTVSILCLVILFPSVFNKLLHVAHVAIKKQKPSEELTINGKAVIRSFILFAIGTFINGTACYFIVLALNNQAGLSSYLYIVGAFGLAGAIGIATPFLPSGIGVRDGVLLVLLTAIMPKDVALAITVFSRLWQVAVDGLFLGAAAVLYKVRPANQK